MSLVTDFQGLYTASTFPDAVQWSEDNLLAVGSGPSVVILNPCNLSGPRMFNNSASETKG
jgi:hypothetical protein